MECPRSLAWGSVQKTVDFTENETIAIIRTSLGTSDTRIATIARGALADNFGGEGYVPGEICSELFHDKLDKDTQDRIAAEFKYLSFGDVDF